MLILIATILVVAFYPNEFISNLAHLLFGLIFLFQYFNLGKKENIHSFSFLVPAIGLVLIYLPYVYTFLDKYSIITLEEDVLFALKCLETLGLYGFGIYVVYMTKKHSEFSAILIDASAMAFSVFTIGIIANWNTIYDFYRTTDSLTLMNTINVGTMTYLFLAYFSQPILEGFNKKIPQLTLLAITLVIFHHAVDVWTRMHYAVDEIPTILIRISRTTYDLGGLCAFWIISQLSLKETSPETPSLFKEFSGPYPVILPFAAAISLLAVPIYSTFVHTAHNSIHIEYIIGIQIFISILFLLRFAILIRNLLGRTSELRYAAFHDQLTDVLNRHGLNRVFKTLRQRRKPNEHYCVAYIDINEFTSINNSYGHTAGDMVLKQLAISLKRLKNQQLVARLGGDEFVVIFSYEVDPPYTSSQLRESLNQWIEYDNHNIYLSVSSGITEIEDDTLDSALENADIAMYSAKLNHTSEFKTNRRETLRPYRQQLKELIQHVIENHNPSIYLQPIYSLRTYKIVAAEVLTRLEDRKGNVVMPDAFISIARDNRQLEAFEKLVVEQLNDVIDQINCHIQINISPDNIVSMQAAKRYYDFINHIKLPLDKVSFEITEKQHIDNPNLERNIRYLHQNGFQFALDDFGTGYSSLDRVANFPIDCIKLDGSLLRAARRGNTAAVHAAVSLAHHLGATTTFECVESEEDVQLCYQLGADNAQGFYLCPPMKLEKFISDYLNIEYFDKSPSLKLAARNEHCTIVH